MKIEIKEIKKNYGKKQVLESVSFETTGGNCVGILGGNGSGKSTLLSILAGVQKADAGAFLYEGKDLFRNRTQRTRLVGYIPQGTPLLEELTAYDNLLLWYDKETLKKELESGNLAMLGVGEFLKVPVSKLSGGMKKRLSIGCAISGRPPVLLLDEPMAALDITCKQKIHDYVQKHKENGGIAILVTHDLMELSLCDQCYIMKNGRLVPFQYTGNVDDLVKCL